MVEPRANNHSKSLEPRIKAIKNPDQKLIGILVLRGFYLKYAESIQTTFSLAVM